MSAMIYTGSFRFPDKDAAATRVNSVALLSVRHGMRVSFAGWETSTKIGRQYTFRGYDCYPMGEFREQAQNPLNRFMAFLFRGHRTLRWLHSNPIYKVVVAYNPPVFFSVGLFILQRIQGFHLILDNTEWYESSHLPGGKFGIAAIENWVRMNWVYPHFKNIICISRFLERHYQGRNTINIPPLIDGNTEHALQRPNDETIRFVYAGNAGKKDLLIPLIRTLPALAIRLKRKVILNIAGTTWTDLARQLAADGLDPTIFIEFIKCHGRLPKEDIPALYSQADFSILLRENKRYARAGFPTKAVESWSMGCPIILNDVGDIGSIASHMEDAIFVELDQLEEDLFAAIDIFLKSGKSQEMRKNCERKALELFSPSAYQQDFSKFLLKAGVPLEPNDKARP